MPTGPPLHEPTEGLPRVSTEAMLAHEERIRDELASLYGQRDGEWTARRLFALLAKQPRTPGVRRLTEADAILIAYPDHLRREGLTPLQALGAFAESHLADAVSAVHVLPFHPYTSDDGFAVSDCESVAEQHGTWEDLFAISRRFRLMVDLVLNHVSSQHPWVARYLRGEQKYEHYFFEPPPDYDLSAVRRPRATPLLTPFERPDGDQVQVWTTFGPDQLDLNYREPRVLLEAMRVLLTHVRRDAYLVRLDAVGFVWKESGTESIHQPGAHTIVRLFRHVLDVAAPDVRLVAETNVPHAENVTYLGRGDREAQLVYNFALPPLLVHTMHTGDATALTEWARTLRVPLPSASFLNFTASHDGIGVTPVRGVLPPADIDRMIARVEDHGGLVSYRARPDGTHEPYELNVSYIDALTAPSASDGERAARFLVSQAIMLALQGVPGIYLHSLLGSRSWPEGVTGPTDRRAINRQKLVIDGDGPDALRLGDLLDPETLRGMVHGPFVRFLRIRRATPAFHPRAPQSVLDLHTSVFALERWTIDDEQRVLALHNVAPDTAPVKLPGGAWRDLITGERVVSEMQLAGYRVAWLVER
jgi:sucrose phosphorylase